MKNTFKYYAGMLLIGVTLANISCSSAEDVPTSSNPNPQSHLRPTAYSAFNFDHITFCNI